MVLKKNYILLSVLLPITLLLLLILSFVFQRFFLVPKILGILFIGFTALLLGRWRPFIKDWLVFISFIYLFDSLRGSIYLLICTFDLPVYTDYVLRIERNIFQQVPSVLLQRRLLNPDAPGHFSWLEKMSTVIHGSHFIVFLLIGFVIWIKKPNHFNHYKISFYLLMIFGLISYLLIPTVPPWMAANHFNLLPPLLHFNVALFNLVIPDICNGFDTNPVAAMPSLHAAFPMLCCLLLWPLYRWKAFPLYGYTLMIFFTIIYTGDHYVVDILAGMILAFYCRLGAFLIINRNLMVHLSREHFLNRVHGGWSGLKKPIIIGIIFFSTGIGLGSYNKNQFNQFPELFNPKVVRYADLINHQDRHRDNFQIQYYLGEYHFFRKRYEKAAYHFEQSLSLNPGGFSRTTIRKNLLLSQRMAAFQKNWLTQDQAVN